MRISKANTFFSTLLLVLIIVGYPLVTTIFLPNFTGDDLRGDVTVSRLVTVPYRAMIVLISLVVIALNRNSKVKATIPLRMYYLFWILLSFRFVYDLLFRTDVIIDPSVVQNQFLYAYLVCLLPAVAVSRCLRVIDYSMAFKLILGGGLLLLLALSYNTPGIYNSAMANQRLTGSIALNPISLGESGAVISLSGLFWAMNSMKVWQKALALFLAFAGMLVLLRSGSRGPLVGIVFCILFYALALQNSSAVAVSLLLLFVPTLYFSMGFLSELVKMVSPVLYARMTLSGTDNQLYELSNGRFDLYGMAIDKFLNNPLFGESYALFYLDGSIRYSHNIILDAFMSVGLFGGALFVGVILVAILNSWRMIHAQKVYSWVGLLCVSFIIRHLFSGAFYQADTLNAFLVIVLSLCHFRFMESKRKELA